MIQNIDYLANPAITKKNSYVARWLIDNQINMLLESKPHLFSIIKERVCLLGNECYPLTEQSRDYDDAFE